MLEVHEFIVANIISISMIGIVCLIFLMDFIVKNWEAIKYGTAKVFSVSMIGEYYIQDINNQ